PRSVTREDISPLLVAELSTEFSSVRVPNNCPRGMYIIPSVDSPLKWNGVFFVHRGPYAGSVLRFILDFPLNYPQTRPTVTFDSEVYHPMIDPKTKVWTPLGDMRHWRPRIHHVPHLLHEIKNSFRTPYLERVTEEDAINKQTFLLWQNSRQTFLSMTAQRALHSTFPETIYDTKMKTLSSAPSTPRK
ncbi:hypothetical protein TREMEDRAFT_18354, partial [Tremella mesenterica DSM 1558]|uniref:uncharacterized protein n=1 Tax=Tremella mesenterica (strain ATCC 24925 / CBS 8224 / DSM 1558 / NBRC 9311 / NRRL Y-6157 / RJB 2259-6 / UBC 559-6) TaxID=578456 RepID=UPI0003F4A5AB